MYYLYMEYIGDLLLYLKKIFILELKICIEGWIIKNLKKKLLKLYVNNWEKVMLKCIECKVILVVFCIFILW